MNTKDIRVQKTYQALTDAFLQLLKTESFNSISINDLCKQSKIGRATFYRHFKNKDDFLHFATKRWVNIYLETGFDNLSNFVERRTELLSSIISSMLHFMDDNRQSLASSYQLDIANVFFSAFRARVEALINDYCAALHGLTFNGNANLLASEIAGAIVYAGTWYQENPDADIDETVESIVTPLDKVLDLYFPAN
ncbi:TetR/AcrR family transcriptional regulator [Nicoliella lavandulae]|uniref:TetR/AcrR family transcriptional regulator n=1 Tax=Nicoliella lavandulae TaxID=3082954 RepID=A0ABU8SM96_9LACO